METRDREELGDWTLNEKNLTLQIHDHRGSLQYEVDLEDCTSSHMVVSWIAQVAGKPYMSDRAVGSLVRKLDEILGLEPSFGGFGPERGPIDLKATMERRAKERADALAHLHVDPNGFTTIRP